MSLEHVVDVNRCRRAAHDSSDEWLKGGWCQKRPEPLITPRVTEPHVNHPAELWVTILTPLSVLDVISSRWSPWICSVKSSLTELTHSPGDSAQIPGSFGFVLSGEPHLQELLGPLEEVCTALFHRETNRLQQQKLKRRMESQLISPLLVVITY